MSLPRLDKLYHFRITLACYTDDTVLQYEILHSNVFTLHVCLFEDVTDCRDLDD